MSNNIFDGVQEVLVEALNLDKEDITLTCTLQKDLGAESIDFLDIVFRLEHKFNIKIAKGEIFKEDMTSEQIQNFTVQDLVKFIESKVKV